MKLTVKQLKQLVKEQVEEVGEPKKLTKAQERSQASRQRRQVEWDAYIAEEDRKRELAAKEKKDARNSVPATDRIEELENKVEELENEIERLKYSVEDFESRISNLEFRSEH